MADSDYERARESFDRALAIARREGDAALEMRTLNHAAQVEFWHHRFEDSLKSSLLAIDLAVATSDPRGEVAARYWASLSSRSLGNLPEVQRQATAMLEPAERLRDRYWLATAYIAIGWWHAIRGAWPSAREATQRGFDLMPLDPRILLQRVFLETQTGNQTEAEVHLLQLVEVARQSGAGPSTANAGLALAAPLARSMLGLAGGPNPFESAIDIILSSPSATPFFLAWARIGASRLAVMDDDAEAAAGHYDALQPLAGFLIIDVCAERILGLLAGTMGDREASTAHFENALTFCRKAGYRPELAWTCHDYAGALLLDAGPKHSPAPEILAKAMELLDESLAISGELGMKPLMERVMGLQESAEAQQVQEPAYPDGLTHREVEVLRLVAAGKSNPEIGRELFISSNTVANHVRNILNKTNTPNRIAAAGYAMQRGLTS